MASAARIHAVEKGKNIQSYPLFSMGGAGPVHVCNVASILGISKIISPVGAGVCSAFGFLSSPLSFDFVRSYNGQLDKLNWKDIMELLNEMEKEGIDILNKSDVKNEDIKINRICEMRYKGQTHDISVPIPSNQLNEDSFEIIKNNFEYEYKKLFSETSKNIPIETLNWRVTVKGPNPNLFLNHGENNKKINLIPKAERKVYFNEFNDYVSTPVYDRTQLSPGFNIEGPAIIEERESTMVVTPKFKLYVDPYFNLILNLKGEVIA